MQALHALAEQRLISPCCDHTTGWPVVTTDIAPRASERKFQLLLGTLLTGARSEIGWRGEEGGEGGC